MVFVNLINGEYMFIVSGQGKQKWLLCSVFLCRQRRSLDCEKCSIAHMAGFPKGREEGIRAHEKNPLSQHLPRRLKAALETRQWNASAFNSSRNDSWVALTEAKNSTAQLRVGLLSQCCVYLELLCCLSSVYSAYKNITLGPNSSTSNYMLIISFVCCVS